MIIKTIIMVLLALVVPLSANENNSKDSWRILSAHCQNLYNDILRYSRSQKEPVAVDSSVFEENLKGIESALEALVKSGELESKVIQLKEIKDIEDERFGKALHTEIDRLTKRYGVWVASEMSGIGEHMRFNGTPHDKSLKLRIRLPKEDMKVIVDNLYKHDLVAAENSAQQAAPRNR